MPTGWWVIEVWNRSPIELLAHVFWVIFSITLHELAHGWTAIRCGDRTPIETGHMTWNPIVHMGQTSLIMFAIAGIAWGAMPIDPSRLRGRYDAAKVAFAGPSLNLLLFAICIAVCAGVGVWGRNMDAVLYRDLIVFFVTGAWLNMLLTLLNLIPVPPLDGWRILSNLSPAYGRLWATGNAPMLAVILVAGVFFVGGRFLSATADKVTLEALRWVLHALRGPR